MITNYLISNGANSDFVERERKDFQRGTWTVDCPQIEIKRRKIENAPILAGAGYIFQDDRQQLRLKVFVSSPEIENPEEVRAIPDLFSNEVGAFIAEDHYFDVVALDRTNRLWNCERVLLSDVDIHAAQGMIIQVDFPELWCESEIPIGVRKSDEELAAKLDRYGYYLTIFQTPKIPRNTTSKTEEEVGEERRSFRSALDAWRFEAAGSKFELRSHEGRLEIRIQSCHQEFEQHALDALFLVLGEPLYPAVSLHSDGKTHRRIIRSKARSFPNARHNPPLHIAPNADWGDENPRTPYRDLVDAYLNLALKHERPRRISNALHAVYAASATQYIDAWVLTLSVVIESLTLELFPTLATPADEFIAQVQDAQDYIEKHPGWDKEWKERLKGSFGSLKSPRVGDRLKAMAKEHAISSKAPQQFSKVRNPTSHSYQAVSFDDETFNRYLSAMEVLFYHVLFHAMEYRGPFTDYSELGFPLKFYPLNSKAKLMEE